MRWFIRRYGFLVSLLLAACGSSQEKASAVPVSGQALATQHCGGCHAYVGPEALPRAIWKNSVLPAMGYRLGMTPTGQLPDSLFESGEAGQRVRRAGVYPTQPRLTDEEWQAVVAYYVGNAPETLRTREPALIKPELPHFRYRPAHYSEPPPLTIMVKILPDQRQVVFGDGKRDVSSLNFLNQRLEHQHHLLLPTTPVHYRAKEDTIWLTTIGRKMYPSDAADGILQKVYRAEPGLLPGRARVVLEGMQRPVHLTYADLNQDGREDILSCEYGHLLGRLVWYENQETHGYVPHVLRNRPGASKAIVTDLNGDALPDIVALFAQGDEGIFLFTNQGNGTFIEERLLTFSPLNGSTSFELVDFNQDGHPDILYTCGDNADQSPILKDHHGVYIYLNDGNFAFQQHYFFPLHGAYQALARDYDQDGDLDIAAISFFPDYERSPEEGFVYLQNQGNFTFRASSFPEVTQGRWIVMDAGDWDGDSDMDLALGSFVGFAPSGDTTGLFRRWLEEDNPSVVVLENTIQ